MNSTQKLSLGDISVNFARVILSTLELEGHDCTALRSSFDLDNGFLDTPDARISIPKYMRLGHRAIEISGQTAIGLKFGQNTHTSDLGLAGLTAACADSIGQALELLIHMEPLTSHNRRGHSKFYIEDERAVCEFYSISPYNKFNLFVVDTMLSAWWHFISEHQKKPEQCHHIEIEYSTPSNVHDYEAFFGCPVLFNQQRNAVVLKQHQHSRPTKKPQHNTFTKLKSLCTKELEQWQQGTNISSKVIELISANLTGAPPEIDTIARKLGVAGWTLRRQLHKEGFQFKILLDDTRNALAQTYVRDTNHNFTEIAFLLGFSTPSAFQRAFKRWTQLSPGQYRKQQNSSK